MTADDDSIIDQLHDLVIEGDRRPDPVRAYDFRPDTWHRWVCDSPAALAVVDHHSSEEPRVGGRPSRADLASLSAVVDESDVDTLLRLFVATMIWGSGTSNGRGPHNTAAALSDGRLVGSLRTTRGMILDGDTAGAYASFRSRGVGPAYFTKWFWAVGLDRNVEPPGLILDTRVWASLETLGWDSRAAAGTMRRAERYVAYLEAMGRWAAALPGLASAEQLEQALFSWVGGR